jgi:hypothetical protein
MTAALDPVALEERFRVLYVPDTRTTWTKLRVKIGEHRVRLDYDPNIRVIHIRHDPHDPSAPPWLRNAYYGTLHLDPCALVLKPIAHRAGVASRVVPTLNGLLN